MSHPTYDSMDDSALIAAYQQSGDKRCIGTIYKRYAALVYGLCFKYLEDETRAEDAVADIFEILIEKLRTEQISYFKSWLYIVSRNHVLRQLRSSGKVREDSYEQMEENNPGVFVENVAEEDLNNEWEHTDLKDALISEAMMTLKAAQQVCIELFYFREKSYQQITSLTGYDIKEVKSHIQNGKRKLRIFFESKGISK